MKLYVASSWRNQYQAAVVLDLRDVGHEVYDFRTAGFHPQGSEDNGFGWREIDPNWQNWTAEKFMEGLAHPTAQRGFNNDFNAMEWADGCVLVLPCGRSAHLEAGWFTGRDKPLYVLIPPDHQEPELMYLLAGLPQEQLHTSMVSLLDAIGTPFVRGSVRPDGQPYPV